jgi:hypothetical protein
MLSPLKLCLPPFHYPCSVLREHPSSAAQCAVVEVCRVRAVVGTLETTLGAGSGWVVRRSRERIRGEPRAEVGATCFVAVRSSGTDRRDGYHTMRHTFAMNYIRNGGDSGSLGHSTLEMTRRYVSLQVADLQRYMKSSRCCRKSWEVHDDRVE